MALSTEEQKLILTIVGKAELRALNEELAVEQQSIIKLNDLLKAGGIQQAHYDGIVQISAQNIQRLNGDIGKLQNSTRDYRQNLTALGYATNDFASVSGDLSQRLNGIANNLPMLLQGLGPAGLGLALSGLVPILGIVLHNWDAIKKSFGSVTEIDHAKSSLDSLKVKIKEIENSPVKLAVDHAELDALKAQMEAMRKGEAGSKAMDGLSSDFETASGAAVRKAIGNSDLGSAGVKRKLIGLDLAGREAADGPLNDLNNSATAAEQTAEKLKKSAEKLYAAGQTAEGAGMEAAAEKLIAKAAADRDQAQGRRRDLGNQADANIGGLFADATKGGFR